MKDEDHIIRCGLIESDEGWRSYFGASHVDPVITACPTTRNLAEEYLAAQIENERLQFNDELIEVIRIDNPETI